MTLYRYNDVTMQPLDRHGSIPLVYQLGEAIRDKIVRRQYALDEPIPTEEQLAEILWCQPDHGATRSRKAC